MHRLLRREYDRTHFRKEVFLEGRYQEGNLRKRETCFSVCKTTQVVVIRLNNLWVLLPDVFRNTCVAHHE